MNESQIVSFPHLFDFIEKHVGENTGVIPAEVVEELQTLIEAYEGYSPTTDMDYKTLLEKLSHREEEIQVLKLELNELQKQLKEQVDSNKHIKKTIMEHKNIHEEIANVHDDKIMELSDELQRVKLENENMKRDQNRVRDQLNAKELKIEEFERKYAELADRYEREFSQKQTHHSQNMQDLNEIKSLLDKKKEECIKLNKDINKYKSKNVKLNTNNSTLMQTIKSNSIIQQNLENTIEKIKKSHEDYVKEVDAKLISYAKLVEELEKELSRPQPSVVKFIEIVKTRPEVIKKKEEETIEMGSDHENEVHQKQELGNLGDYSEFLPSDRHINFIDQDGLLNQNSFNYDIDRNQFLAKLESNLASDFDTIGYQQTPALVNDESQEFEQMLDKADQHLSMEEDDDPTVVFPKTNRRKASYTEPIQELDFEKKMDEVLSKPKPIGLRESMLTPVSESRFETNKDDLKQKLDEMITKRMTITRDNRKDLVDTFKFKYEDHTLAQGLHSTVEVKEAPPSLPQLPSEIKLSQIKEDTTIDMETFLTFIEFLENYLAGPKNPTTLTLTDYEKANLIRKFEEAEKKNFRKFFVVIMKYFLEYINFEECQISNLIHAKSYLEIKVENMKSEFNFLLKNFIDKNQKNQNLFNDLNGKFDQLKEANRNKLYNYRESISKREPIDKEKRKASNDTPDNQRKHRQPANETSTSKNPKNVSKYDAESDRKRSRQNINERDTKARPRDRTSFDAISEYESVKESQMAKKKNIKANESLPKEAKEEPKDESMWSKFVSVVSFK